MADTLAAVSELAAPGLDELREAALATLCGGETEKLDLIREKLEIGEKLGEVPAETPSRPPAARPRKAAEAPAPQAFRRRT